jgi:hypothetical protein
MYFDLFLPFLKSIKTKYLSLDIKYLLKISIVLYLLTLPMPFIWLEIGPLRKDYFLPYESPERASEADIVIMIYNYTESSSLAAARKDRTG